MVRKYISLFIVLAALLTSCSERGNTPADINTVGFDLDSIRSRGKLIAVTDFNSTNYFIYKGEPMGFHYELLKSFAEYLGVDLEIITENHVEHAYDLLGSGEADLMAMGLTVNASGRKRVNFSDPVIETRQVLVQRKPRIWKTLTEDEISRRLIRNQLTLAGKTVYVQENSTHAERLRNLEEEMGDSINIIEVPYDAEALIQNVARGDIDYTVCDENIALVNSRYYDDLDIATPVSFPQNISWGLRKSNSEKLMTELNTWLGNYKRTHSFALLYAKYFRNSRSTTIVRSDYYALSTGKISQWDDQLKGASEAINWDWKLLASLVYQESRFDPDARSWAGAYGLMQVMPETGTHFGIDITSSPSDNIKAGTKYIQWLHTIFDIKIPDPDERIKFILASYNAGPGHVLDAMNLAAKNGMDPVVWDNNVEIWLLRKSKPEYFNDPVVKNGYFRGTESVNFVNEVLERYEHYRNIVPEAPVAQLRLGMLSK